VDCFALRARNDEANSKVIALRYLFLLPPYFRFEPVVSYQLTRNINTSFLFTYGICKDVVESDWRLKPVLTFTFGGFGAMRAELYYELNAIIYTDEAVSSAKSNFIAKMMQVEGGKAIYKHNVCLSVMWMF
jgi:hypothetical protein